MKDGSLRTSDINAFLDVSAYTVAAVPLASTSVRLRPDSPLRERLEPFADEVGRVIETHQLDDDELRICVAYPDQLDGWLVPLSAEEFVVDLSHSDEPF